MLVNKRRRSALVTELVCFSAATPLLLRISVQGLSLKNVELLIDCNGKLIGKFFGEMLFTHFGASGPIILSASSLINGLDLGMVKLSLDLKPALIFE